MTRQEVCKEVAEIRDRERGKIMSDKEYNITITCGDETLEKIEGYLALLELIEGVDFEIEEDQK